MVAVKGFTKIVSCLSKAQRSTSAQEADKAVFDFFKKMTNGYGTDVSPHVYKGKNLEELPGFVQQMLTKLKKPTVTVNGRSRIKGEGILGFTIKDGNKTVSTSALGLDCNRGEPILQFRHTLLNGEEKALSFNAMLNTNLSGTSALKSDVFIDSKLATEMGLPESIIKGLPKIQKASAKSINEQIADFRTLLANRGSLIRSIDDCSPAFLQIASKTGKVTQKSAQEALCSALKAMGYNPKDVKLAFCSKEASQGGSFNMVSGELELNINMLRNHQDFADVLAHELTHMEDFVMLYKQVGPKEFQKLLGGENFNKKWYDKMSKYITDKHFAYQNNGKCVAVELPDGTKITDPKLIKEHLLKYPVKKFDVDVMKSELKREIQLYKKEYSGQYSRLKDMDEYLNSSIEKHARQVEEQLKMKMEQAGIFRKTKLSTGYGQAKYDRYDDLSRLFRQIEEALGKNGIDKKFNELYSQSLCTVDAELGKLKVAIDKGILNGEDVSKLCQQFEEVVNNRYHYTEYLDTKILYEMAKKLGLY